MAKINLLVVDDEKLFAEFIADHLNSVPGINVVDVLYDGSGVFDAIKNNKIDVILLDLSMPRVDGLETVKKLRAEAVDIKIIVLTSIIEPTVLKKLLNIGTDGVITKNTRKEEIGKGIKIVMAGGSFYSKEIIAQFTEMPTFSDQTSIYPFELTKRELEILELIASQYTSQEIAEKLVISLRTVETHRRNMLKKLNVKNSAGLIQTALERKLIQSVNLKITKKSFANP